MHVLNAVKVNGEGTNQVTIMPGWAPGSVAERKIWEPEGSLAARIIPSERPNGVFHAWTTHHTIITRTTGKSEGAQRVAELLHDTDLEVGDVDDQTTDQLFGLVGGLDA